MKVYINQSSIINHHFLLIIDCLLPITHYLLSRKRLIQQVRIQNNDDHRNNPDT